MSLCCRQFQGPIQFQDVSIMANSLEKFFLSKVKQMPAVEFEMTPEQLRRPSSKKNPVARGKLVLPPGSSPSTSDTSLSGKKPDLGSCCLLISCRIFKSSGPKFLCPPLLQFVSCFCNRFVVAWFCVPGYLDQTKHQNLQWWQKAANWI